MVEELEDTGLPLVRSNCIKFGKTLGEGAFGTVKLAEVHMDGVTQGERGWCGEADFCSLLQSVAVCCSG